jgi:hypothetical protein
MAPTGAPTPHPTASGFAIVEVAVDTQAVVAAIEFDVTPEQAANPVLQLSMREGFASALNPATTQLEHVTIVEVGGQAVVGNRHRSRDRNLQQTTTTTTTVVKFEVVSPDPVGVAGLDSAVKAAAASGDIVASIIRQAEIRSVLTPAMAQMEVRVTNLQTSLRATTVTVVQSVPQATQDPTPSPTATPIVDPDPISNGAIIAIAVVAAVVVIGGIAFCACRSSSPGSSSSGASSSPPVGFGSAEGALSSTRRTAQA